MGLISRISAAIDANFSSFFQSVFHPMNDLLLGIGEFWWTVCAVLLFCGAIGWVWTLRKEYVNLDAPHKGILYDLRIWTIISMVPHILIYIVF